MPKRIINEGILVIRDGKRVRPEIGKAFNLTDDEIKQLEAIRPEAIAKIGQVEDDPRSSDDDGKGDGMGAAKTEDGKGDDDAKPAAPANNKTGGRGTGKAGGKAAGNADGL